MSRGSLGLAFLFSALLSMAARAEPPPPIRLTVRPAVPPEPSLKYQFLPDEASLVPGNGAVFYLRALSPSLQAHRRIPDVSDKVDRWKKTPVKDLPQKEMAWLQSDKALRELDYGARHETCDWELRDRLRTESIALLLPEIQSFRESANLLAVRARLEAAERRYDAAVATLQTGFRMAVDIAEGPTLIHCLVGVAFAGIMADQVETLIEQPGMPNLYWALTALPQPLIRLRKPLAGEKLMEESLVPRLKELETTIMTPAEIQEQLDHAVAMIGERGNRALLALLVARSYPEAKSALIKKGRRPEQVEAMPALQAVMLYSLDQYRRLRDNSFRWVDLPYWQAISGMRRAEEDLKAARASGSEGLPFASLLLPATPSIVRARARTDRHIAALRCIEAIRLHAAAHDGKPPARLSDVSEVPIPADPMTGNGFVYEVSGDRFTLQGPPPAGEPANPNNTVRYEVTISQPGQ